MSTAVYTQQETRPVRENKVSSRLLRAAIGLAGSVVPELVGSIGFSLMIHPRRRPRRLLTGDGIDQVRLSYRDRKLQGYTWKGERNLLLVHGWDASSADFFRLIPELQRAGWGGLAYDAPAHGRSDGEITDFLDMGFAFRSVLEQCGPFDAVLGHSFGSSVALYQLDRVAGDAPARVISASAPVSLTQIFDIYYHRYGLPAGVRQDINRRARRHLGRRPADISITGAAGRLRSKLLIMHDRDDELIPYAAAAQLLRSIPDAELLSTAGLGHRGWLRDQGVQRRLIRFLDDGALAPDNRQAPAALLVRPPIGPMGLEN